MYKLNEWTLPKSVVIAGEASECTVGEDSLPAIRAYLHQASLLSLVVFRFRKFTVKICMHDRCRAVTIQSVLYPPTDSLTHPPAHSVTHPPHPSPTHSPTQSLTLQQLPCYVWYMRLQNSQHFSGCNKFSLPAGAAARFLHR